MQAYAKILVAILSAAATAIAEEVIRKKVRKR
jgi:hypothetical protein